MKFKVLELFGGIGACSKALERIGVDYEIADYVEIDKYAVKSFNAIHNTNFEPQDVCEWDKDIKVDLLMHGSPCQDFSVAGLQKSGDKGSGTRSSLMWETIRIVEKIKPKYVIWENVKNLLSKKHIHNFNAYLETMKNLGYTNYYQVLNAKNYGIPQNRERVFTISIRNDIDKGYTFPEPQELKLKLKDMLEDEVDEKYYISEDRSKQLINDLQNKKTLMLDVCRYKRDWKDPRLIQVGVLNIKGQDIVKRVYFEEGLCPTLTNMQGGNRQPKVIGGVRENINNITLKSKCKRLSSLVNKIVFKKGKVLNMDLYNQTTNENVSQCLTEPHHNSQRLFDGLRIRKLTPKECWRLMGFDDEDFEKAAKVNSNAQLYKQAGNSIVVNVLVNIFTNLLGGVTNEK